MRGRTYFLFGFGFFYVEGIMGRKIKWVGSIVVGIIVAFFFTANLGGWTGGSNVLVLPRNTIHESVLLTHTEEEQPHLSAAEARQGTEQSQPVQFRDDLTDREPKEVPSEEEPAYVDHEILIQFVPEMSKDEIINLLNGLGMSIVKVLNSKNLCRVKLPESIQVEEALKIFEDVPDILFSEPNYLIHTTKIPNDPSFSNQWGLHNTGSGGGTEDADIDAAEVWNITTGSSTVVVAVVDEGIDLNHTDLADNIWTNSNEIAGNDIDDDGNGFVDDVNGWDFYHGDATVYHSKSQDSHGTAVAGIIGAVGDNGVGTAGVCWNVRIMPVKFIAYGSGTISDAILALNYAVTNGARVINCSWGGSAYSSSLKAAFQDVLNAGVLVVTSAGNSAKNTDNNSHYPSNYDLDNIISVASTDKNDELSYFSNYGKITVDLAAPGSSIYTTKPENTYSYFSGTSAATPFVTGAAAMALSVNSSLTYQELKDQILNNVDPVNSLTNKTVTGGRLNINNMTNALMAGDADNDGLPNMFEIQYGLNPNDPSDAETDPDGDGLTNLQEYDNGTNPTNADTDGDGLPDGYEITNQLDPTSDSDASGDLDGDGLSNLMEYQTGTRVDLTDTDGDGIDDFTEFGPHDFPADSDGDGIYDALDLDSDDDGKSDLEEGVGDDDDDGAANYVDMDDSDGPTGDQDGDGLANSVEITYLLYPNLPDSDGDGIDDGTEFGEGATPLDSDGDETPDALDMDSDNDGKSDTLEGTGDQDGDGIPNYRDSNDFDGSLGDADGDGLINQLEAAYGMNINLADSDGDGIDDYTEFGTGPTPLDTDEDGTIDALDLDSDNDGALDQIEAGSDTDGDGVPDGLDQTIANMLTSYGKLSLIIQGQQGELKNVAFLNRPASETLKEEYDYRYGGVQYQISGLNHGESVEVVIKNTASFPSNTEFWKYNNSGKFYEYPATVSGKTLQFILTDGEKGDDDGLVNGTIVDPGYMVIPVASSNTGGSTSTPATSGGGGGGGSGCSLSPHEVPVKDGMLDFLVFLMPMGVLVMLRLFVPKLYPRAQSKDPVS